MSLITYTCKDIMIPEKSLEALSARWGGMAKSCVAWHRHLATIRIYAELKSSHSGLCMAEPFWIFKYVARTQRTKEHTFIKIALLYCKLRASRLSPGQHMLMPFQFPPAGGVWYVDSHFKFKRWNFPLCIPPFVSDLRGAKFRITRRNQTPSRAIIFRDF